MADSERLLTLDEIRDAEDAGWDSGATMRAQRAALLAAQDAKTLRAVAGLLRGLRGERCLCEAEDPAWDVMNHHPACVELRRMLAGAKEAERE